MSFSPYDAFGFASKLSLAKAINASKILSSYYYSRMRSIPDQWGLPISISIEPTTSCNLRCPECPSGLRSFSRPTGMMDKKFFSNIIDELKEHLLYLTFYFQGEPFLNTDFLEMVKYASSKNIYTSTSTNAHYLNDEVAEKTIKSGLNRLIISIDGTTQESYQQYRIGGSLQKVLDGAANVVKWKQKLKSKTPHLIFQFIVVRHNEHQLDEVKSLAKKIGVNEVVFKTAQVYDYEQGNDLIPLNEKFSRYKKQANGTWAIKNKLLNHCWKMWHSCVITWDGSVVPCCFDKDASHRFGNLKESSFADVWFGEKYKEFRKNLLVSRSKIDICKNCSEGTKVFSS
jgi:radical SAM protein with 4Fe4S-binding SPASM domain